MKKTFWNFLGVLVLVSIILSACTPNSNNTQPSVNAPDVSVTSVADVTATLADVTVTATPDATATPQNTPTQIVGDLFYNKDTLIPYSVGSVAGMNEHQIEAARLMLFLTLNDPTVRATIQAMPDTPVCAYQKLFDNMGQDVEFDTQTEIPGGELVSFSAKVIQDGHGAEVAPYTGRVTLKISGAPDSLESGWVITKKSSGYGSAQAIGLYFTRYNNTYKQVEVFPWQEFCSGLPLTVFEPHTRITKELLYDPEIAFKLDGGSVIALLATLYAEVARTPVGPDGVRNLKYNQIPMPQVLGPMPFSTVGAYDEMYYARMLNPYGGDSLMKTVGLPKTEEGVNELLKKLLVSAQYIGPLSAIHGFFTDWYPTSPEVASKTFLRDVTNTLPWLNRVETRDTTNGAFAQAFIPNYATSAMFWMFAKESGLVSDLPDQLVEIGYIDGKTKTRDIVTHTIVEWMFPEGLPNFRRDLLQDFPMFIGEVGMAPWDYLTSKRELNELLKYANNGDGYHSYVGTVAANPFFLGDKWVELSDVEDYIDDEASIEQDENGHYYLVYPDGFKLSVDNYIAAMNKAVAPLLPFLFFDTDGVLIYGKWKLVSSTPEFEIWNSYRGPNGDKPVWGDDNVIDTHAAYWNEAEAFGSHTKLGDMVMDDNTYSPFTIYNIANGYQMFGGMSFIQMRWDWVLSSREDPWIRIPSPFIEYNGTYSNPRTGLYTLNTEALHQLSHPDTYSRIASEKSLSHSFFLSLIVSAGNVKPEWNTTLYFDELWHQRSVPMYFWQNEGYFTDGHERIVKAMGSQVVEGIGSLAFQGTLLLMTDDLQLADNPEAINDIEYPDWVKQRITETAEAAQTRDDVTYDPYAPAYGMYVVTETHLWVWPFATNKLAQFDVNELIMSSIYGVGDNVAGDNIERPNPFSLYMLYGMGGTAVNMVASLSSVGFGAGMSWLPPHMPEDINFPQGNYVGGWYSRSKDMGDFYLLNFKWLVDANQKLGFLTTSEMYYNDVGGVAQFRHPYLLPTSASAASHYKYSSGNPVAEHGAQVLRTENYRTQNTDKEFYEENPYINDDWYSPYDYIGDVREFGVFWEEAGLCRPDIFSDDGECYVVYTDADGVKHIIYTMWEEDFDKMLAYIKGEDGTNQRPAVTIDEIHPPKKIQSLDDLNPFCREYKKWGYSPTLELYWKFYRLPGKPQLHCGDGSNTFTDAPLDLRWYPFLYYRLSEGKYGGLPANMALSTDPWTYLIVEGHSFFYDTGKEYVTQWVEDYNARWLAIATGDNDGTGSSSVPDDNGEG